MLDLSSKLKCDFAVLSCLLTKDNEEVKDAINYIRNKTLDFPMFIFTQEELFATSHTKFNKYFELTRRGEFITGPVLVLKEKNQA